MRLQNKSSLELHQNVTKSLKQPPLSHLYNI